MIKAKWVDGRREPQCPPNPAYPDGIDVDMSRSGQPFCSMDLEHPTKRCGYWVITCDTCDYSAVLTTAGRPDDPRSVRVPCKGN